MHPLHESVRNSRMSGKRDVSLFNIPAHSILESIHTHVVKATLCFSKIHTQHHSCKHMLASISQNVEMCVQNVAHQYSTLGETIKFSRLNILLNSPNSINFLLYM